MKNKKVSIIGAGTMGCGVALDCAIHGYMVTLIDNNKQQLAQAKNSMKSQFRELHFFIKGLPKSWGDLNISTHNNISEIKKSYFVIENITESIDKKKELYRELNQYIEPNTIIGINTSCIPISHLAEITHNPKQIIGIHFMNPAPLKKLVELMIGRQTATSTIEETKVFLKSLNKTFVVANDSPGFISNRLSHLLMNEAIFLVYENVAKPKDIDLLFKEGYGHQMGPLETADLIGLDTVLATLKILHNEFHDDKFKCCPLLSKMVSAGKLGKKSGEGFYSYNEDLETCL